LQPIERIRRDRVECLPVFGENQRTRPPLEQRHAEVVLERLDLPADSGLGDEQLLRRLGEAQSPRRRLEPLEEPHVRQAIAPV